MKIIIQGAITNFGDLNNQQLLEYLKNQAEEFEYYTYQRDPEMVSAASFDWMVIGDISAVLDIASFIWLAYSVLVKPRQKPDSNAGIIIHIENMGDNNQFWIGKDIKSEKELLEKIQDSLSKIQIDVAETKKEVNSIKNSKKWKRIK